ncbi:MAG: MarR family transcriptional regulator [Eubacteriales bacterium]|nr:MarR family transcriptional regulator [Eubacteriales bacterium]
MHPFDFENYEDKGMQGLMMEMSRRYAGKCFHQIMESGIYPGQVPVLRLLAEKDGYNQREIAQRLRIKPPTVNVTIQRLEKSGTVFRKQDENDQRVTRIYLTDKGRKCVSEAMGKIMANEKLIFGNFSETEICLMRRFFRQIIENIDAIPGPSREDCMRKEGLDKC